MLYVPLRKRSLISNGSTHANLDPRLIRLLLLNTNVKHNFVAYLLIFCRSTCSILDLLRHVERNGPGNVLIVSKKIEAASQPPGVFCKKKVFVKISQNSQENNCARVSFIEKETGAGVVFLWIFRNFKNTFSYRTTPLGECFWKIKIMNFWSNYPSNISRVKPSLLYRSYERI